MPLRFPLRLLLLIALASPRATAQTGSCDTGTAVGVLETASLRAELYNIGGLFWRGSGASYVVPKEAGISPVFTASLWVSGRVDGELRMAAGQYGPWEFWPGPLADADAPPADCSAHDRIWTVSRADVAAYLQTGEATPDLAEWPHDLGAPVLDGDGISGNYDLAAGDQPDLLGDMAVWWVMNDAGNEHLTSGFGPLGIEVRAQAFAFDRTAPSDLTTDTFYRYEIVNRRDRPIDSLRVSLWADAELGNFNDDLVGVDTLRHFTYVYNGDDDDDGGGGYGETPPAWGIQVLSGFVGLANGRDDDFDGTVDEADEEMRMTSAPMPWKGLGAGYGEGFYALQRGLLQNGQPMLDYGSGRSPDPSALGEPTVFAFPAFPGEYWSEENIDGNGTANAARDSRIMLTIGPGRLEPGESVTVDFAMPFAQGTDRLDSVRKLIDRAALLLNAFGDGEFDSRLVTPEEAGIPPQPLPAGFLPTLSPVRPNPAASGQVALLTLPEPMYIDAVVLDALGRRLAVVARGTQGAGVTVLAVPDGLPPGLYLLRVSAAQGRPVALRFTVAAR
ncbi:T9SS type A sorting domain-containing protein [Rubrivirga sp. IMCC43871]|uniref:T9SS type A sorting domain-containing protein n=1 Tax=Rubrivirga sp. IMCC43871 TaxID=3391575 RepID=UPI00398FEF07